jgi:general secretion pathway protein C
MNPLAKLTASTMHIVPRVRIVLDILLVALLGLLVARILWIAIDRSGAVSKPLPQFVISQSGSANARVPRGDTTILTRVNYFKRADGSASGTALVPSAPPTTLNLKLKGVRSVTGESGANGTDAAAIAIIQMSDKQARSFGPGDTIVDGVTLDRVLPDRVLLRKGGGLETLMMESNADTLAVLSLPGQEGMIQGEKRPGVVESRPATVDRALLASLNVAPVLEDGNLVGYRLSSPAALSGTGIESGDILTSLDGTPVKDIDIQSLTERLAQAPEISMTVKRGNADVPVTLRFPEGE